MRCLLDNAACFSPLLTHDTQADGHMMSKRSKVKVTVGTTMVKGGISYKLVIWNSNPKPPDAHGILPKNLAAAASSRCAARFSACAECWSFAQLVQTKQVRWEADELVSLHHCIHHAVLVPFLGHLQRFHWTLSLRIITHPNTVIEKILHSSDISTSSYWTRHFPNILS